MMRALMAFPFSGLTTAVLTITLGWLLLPVAAKAEIKVDIDFPGGSGEVVELDQAKPYLKLNPTDHPGKGWRCWWYVRLSGLEAGKTLTLDVGEAPWATPDRASYSTDGGRTWQHSEPGIRTGKRIRYQLTPESGEMRVAWGPPFVLADAAALVEKAAASPGIETFSLCRTREDHDTPALRSLPTNGVPDAPLVWLNARQHAWESGASWVAKGFAEWLTSDDPSATRLRQTAEVVLVPIMDIDNVYRGAGGKNQTPQDHNRDWTSKPHWHAVEAAQREIRAAAEKNRLAIYVDLHNPSASDRFPYFYVPPQEILSAPARENLSAFLELAKEEMTGPLRFTGKTIVSGQKYDPKAWNAISKNWIAGLGTPAVAVTLETAWNTPSSHTEGYEAVGRQLGRAIIRYLER